MKKIEIGKYIVLCLLKLQSLMSQSKGTYESEISMFLIFFQKKTSWWPKPHPNFKTRCTRPHLKHILQKCYNKSVADPNLLNHYEAFTPEVSKSLRDWPAKKCNPSPGNFGAHFLFCNKTKTTYPGVHLPILSSALRPKLRLWWPYHF